MLKVGLTGGIGSGKTAVSDTFSELGVAVIDTDIVAREVLVNKPELLDQLKETFGTQIVNSDGTLDRAALRSAAFSNQENKQKLDNIMHPAIRSATLEQMQSASSEYCVVVVPLLIETNFKALVDRVLVVTAPYEKRVQWIAKRSGLDRAETEAIINSQTSDAKRLEHATEHLTNDNSLESLRNKVKELHQTYLALSKQTNN